jgi:hypothetical protein
MSAVTRHRIAPWLAFGVALASTACSGDDDGRVLPDTIATLSTATVESSTGDEIVTDFVALQPLDSEPVTTPPEPIDACALLDGAVRSLLVDATATPEPDGCRWEGPDGFLAITVRSVPVGVSPREAFAAHELEMVTEFPEGVTIFGLLRVDVDHTEIELFWDQWQATVTSDQPAPAVYDALGTVPEISAETVRSDEETGAETGASSTGTTVATG